MSGQGVGGSLRRAWLVALTVGELVGFVPPALVGAWLATRGSTEVVLVAGLVAAGCLEGLVIGLAGRRVLRRHAPSVDTRGWVAGTALAAGVAWAWGMGASALLGDGAAAWELVLLIPLGPAALLGMGWAQWLVLRRSVARSGRWVPVSGLAWLVGVAIPVTALSLVPSGAPAAAHVVVGVLSAVAMGATVAAITGHTLQRILEPTTDRSAPEVALPARL